MNKFNKYLITLMSIFTIGGVASCGNNEINSPIDAIIDAYGDKQFRISFDSTNLDEPISDIYYSAKNMPTLPTPSKVGYVFDGWFFDSTLLDQCDVEKGDLFWKMCNVTLYAKWDFEEIVNNGQYDIEFEAHIDEDTLAFGPVADHNEYYRFNEDIIESGTYIEKNVHGTFLRIQYDCRTRGPVLGSEDSDQNNFSKQTYTVTDIDNRISEELSILDRTSTIQTIYYNIEGLDISDTITLFVEYYNWEKNMPDDLRPQATVTYNVEFNITRFIGFGASFMNPETTLEDGIYEIPTHYTELDKSISMLDMFNPVISYVVAKNGNYKLYKPMNIYNNDFPTLNDQLYSLRTTGFSKEFTATLIDQDLIVKKEEIHSETDIAYIPFLLGVDKFVPITLEFNATTAKYYYIVDLGKKLDKDVVFFGGSSGAMESMFSFPYDYRRLTLDYDSMTRIPYWDYKELSGDYYSFKKNLAFYPGDIRDFEDNNTDFDIYNKYRSAIDYSNVFYSLAPDGSQVVYDSRITITPTSYVGPLKYSRNSYQYFDMSIEVFGYDPKDDGMLYSRDVSFTTSSVLKYSNSSIGENINGKSVKLGENINLNDLYKEKVSNKTEPYTYKAYKVNDKLEIDYSSEIKVEKEFKFSSNIAICYTSKVEAFNRTGTVILALKEEPVVRVDKGWDVEANNIITTTNRFNIGDSFALPDIKYSYYGKSYSTRSLIKDDAYPDKKCTDFIHTSYYVYENNIYTSLNYLAGEETDFIINNDRIRALVQLENQFGEFTPYIVDIKCKEVGDYEVLDGEKVIHTGELSYDGNQRKPINYEIKNLINILDETSINSIPSKLTLNINDGEFFESKDINLEYAIIYLKTQTLKITNLNEIWEKIKEEPYALIYLSYSSDGLDRILYKAQYNFKVDGLNLDKFNVINQNKSYFTHSVINLEKPILTTRTFNKVSKGYLNVLKKEGNNYVKSYDAYSNYSKDGSHEVEFKQVGTYLLTWQFEFTYDKNGDPTFEAINPDETISTIKFNISEEVEVFDRNSPITLTYVTDIAHPFDENSKELQGYSITSRDGRMYASKVIKDKTGIVTLTKRAFKETSDTLYKWANEKGKMMKTPQSSIKDIHLVTESINPTLYAGWDSGAKLDVYTEIDGVETYYKSINVRRDPRSGSELYEFDSGLLRAEGPKGYKVFGWKADQNVFLEEIMIDGQREYIRVDFRKGDMKGLLSLSGDTKFTAIFKKPVSVIYEAYDEAGTKLKFLNSISGDFGLFMGETLKDSVSKAKFKQLENAASSDISLELKYWEVYDYETDTMVKVDIYNFTLLERYSKNKSIKLRAIFG